jgi:ATPase subunit of ABC transporter with duplicated ATPase domains
MSLFYDSDLKVCVDGKTLISNTELSISNYKYSLVGKNGCGKTTLLNHIYTNAKEFSYMIEQEVSDLELLPTDYLLYRMNEEIYKLHKKFIETNDVDIENKLAETDYHDIMREINIILTGFGFTEERKLGSYSGGERMKISLAVALLLKPKLLLLDEATNHLDLDNIEFLIEYLQDYPYGIISVSHDEYFIDQITDTLLWITPEKTIRCFKNCSYKQFREQMKKEYDQKYKNFKDYEKKLKDMRISQKTKEDIEKYVKKNEVKQPEKPYEVKIIIPQVPIISNLIIDAQNVSYGELFENINFGVAMDSRITITGKNGVGKTTFLKLLINTLEPTSGYIWRDQRIRIGYYSQHATETMPLDLSPVDFIRTKIDINEESARRYLGTIGLPAENHLIPIGSLSGGQKARVLLISILVDKPHILFLDEPTNHLDIETINALGEAIKRYEGGLVMITHNRKFIENTDSVIYEIKNKKISRI